MTTHRRDSPQGAVALSALYILDEIAMCLRITECGGFNHEYYPREELPVLRQLYEGQFEPDGLTVLALVGHEAKRIFRPLESLTAGTEKAS